MKEYYAIGKNYNSSINMVFDAENDKDAKTKVKNENRFSNVRNHEKILILTNFNKQTFEWEKVIN